MPDQFFSPEGDIEEYFVSEYWLIDQYVGDQLWIWGSGFAGSLGNAQTTNVSTPVTTFAGGTNWEQISDGAAIKTDGTLWSWGLGNYGILGNAQTTNRSTPVTTFAGGTNWKQVSTKSGHAAAIKTDGTLWTWGYAGNGQLGNGATSGNISTPVTTFAGGTNWKQVSCGNSYTVAIKTNGTLWSWGIGLNGRLGNAQTTNRSTPVPVSGGGTWKQVSAGQDYVAAIKTNGTLWVWGDGSYGALGNGVITGNISTPVTTFAGGTNWKQVSAGSQHTAAIKTDGTLWTWGRGISGQLGNGVTTGNISTPVTTFAGGTNWKQVGIWFFHSAAIKTDGTLWIWGSGGNGRLGNAQTTDRSTPVTTFAGGTNWKQVSSYAAVQSGINAEYPLS